MLQIPSQHVCCRVRNTSAPYACCHNVDFVPHLLQTSSLHPFLDAGPSQRKWNIAWEMVLLVLAWLGVTIAYVVVRATKSLHLGPATAYGVWVLVMEALGATTLVIYSIHLCVRIRKFTPPQVSSEQGPRCQDGALLSTCPSASARQEGTQTMQRHSSAQGPLRRCKAEEHSPCYSTVQLQRQHLLTSHPAADPGVCVAHCPCACSLSGTSESGMACVSV